MQRLSIARAMMHDPAVLFLDEPSAGLESQTRLLLSEMVRDCNARGKTILLTTHNMEEAMRRATGSRSSINHPITGLPNYHITNHQPTLSPQILRMSPALRS